jgi:hypothetical protein
MGCYANFLRCFDGLFRRNIVKVVLSTNPAVGFGDEVHPRDRDTMQRINASPSARALVTESFQDSSNLIKMFASDTSTVYTDKNAENVLKVFNRDPKSAFLGTVEMGVYAKSADLPHTPKVRHAYSSPQLSFLIMGHLGMDAFEITQQGLHRDYYTWELMVVTLVNTLARLHETGALHGDVKLENVTFDGKEWHFIDFGLAEQHRNSVTFSGTFPYVLPHYGGARDTVNFRSVDDKKRAADCFALCLTLLAFAGVDVDSGGKAPCVPPHCGNGEGTEICRGTARISITPYCMIKGDAANFTKSTWPEMPSNARGEALTRALSEVVLSQLDVSFEYLIWGPHSRTCRYAGKSPYQASARANIFDAWDNLVSLTKPPPFITPA